MRVEPPGWDQCPDERDPQSSCLSSVRTEGKRTFYKPGGGCPPTEHAHALISNFRSPDLGDILCCLSHPMGGFCFSSLHRLRHPFSCKTRVLD